MSTAEDTNTIPELALGKKKGNTISSIPLSAIGRYVVPLQSISTQTNTTTVPN